MSVPIGVDFEEAVAVARGLRFALQAGFFVGDTDDQVKAQEALDYIRKKLWYTYPYKCEEIFIQNEQYSIDYKDE